MVAGLPDPARFESVVGGAVRDAIERSRNGAIRAYGDMVGTLWKNRQFPAAIRLEQLWNRLRKSTPFALYCGYPIDVFDSQFDAAVVDALLCAHSHLLPAGSGRSIESAIAQAMEEMIASSGKTFPKVTESVSTRRLWPELPRCEALILWLLTRARQVYNASA